MSSDPSYPHTSIFSHNKCSDNYRNGVVKLSFGNMTLELNVFNVCKQSNFDEEEVQDINLIKKVCEKDDVMSFYISDPLEMTLMTNTKFLNKFKLDDTVQFTNYINNAQCMNIAGGYLGRKFSKNYLHKQRN